MECDERTDERTDEQAWIHRPQRLKPRDQKPTFRQSAPIFCENSAGGADFFIFYFGSKPAGKVPPAEKTPLPPAKFPRRIPAPLAPPIPPRRGGPRQQIPYASCGTILVSSSVRIKQTHRYVLLLLFVLKMFVIVFNLALEICFSWQNEMFE